MVSTIAEVIQQWQQAAVQRTPHALAVIAGAVPRVATWSPIEGRGLQHVDGLVLQLACEAAVKDESDLIDPNELYVQDGHLLLPELELSDAIEMLEQRYMVRVHHVLGGGLSSFQITTHGFETYARACIPGYDGIVRDVASALVNRQEESDQDIAADLERPLFLVQHILTVFEDAGHIKLSKAISGPIHIYNVAASCAGGIGR